MTIYYKPEAYDDALYELDNKKVITVAIQFWLNPKEMSVWRKFLYTKFLKKKIKEIDFSKEESFILDFISVTGITWYFERNGERCSPDLSKLLEDVYLRIKFFKNKLIAKNPFDTVCEMTTEDLSMYPE